MARGIDGTVAGHRLCSRSGVRCLAIVLAIAALCARDAAAATYFTSPSGRDTNSGSISAPFRTLSAAIARLRPGDQLLVRGGVYRESIRIWDKPGTPAAPIHITPYAKEVAVIDGQSASGDAVVSIGQSSWVFFDRFEVRNGAESGILVYDSHEIRVRWNNVHDHAASGIQIRSGSGSRRGTTHHVVVNGNRVYRTVRSNERRQSGRWSQAVAAWRAENVTIAGNYVFENFGEGIDAVVSDRVVIAANHVWDNFGVNIYLDNATSTVVDRNFVLTGLASDPQKYFRDGRPAIGIAVANERYPEQNPLRDLAITNNIVLFCRFGFAYGDWVRGGGIHRAVIANNTFFDQSEAAIYLEPVRSGGHSAVTVVNNIVFQRDDHAHVGGSPAGFSFRANCWWGGDEETRRTGPGDIVGDPLLVHGGGTSPDDYRLTRRSPCIDRGAPEGAVRTDFWGVRRSGAIDIGAAESG